MVRVKVADRVLNCARDSVAGKRSAGKELEDIRREIEESTKHARAIQESMVMDLGELLSSAELLVREAGSGRVNETALRASLHGLEAMRRQLDIKKRDLLYDWKKL